MIENQTSSSVNNVDERLLTVGTLGILHLHFQSVDETPVKSLHPSRRRINTRLF